MSPFSITSGVQMAQGPPRTEELGSCWYSRFSPSSWAAPQPPLCLWLWELPVLLPHLCATLPSVMPAYLSSKIDLQLSLCLHLFLGEFIHASGCRSHLLPLLGSLSTDSGPELPLQYLHLEGFSNFTHQNQTAHSFPLPPSWSPNLHLSKGTRGPIITQA